jgi:hypothetical protein
MGNWLGRAGPSLSDRVVTGLQGFYDRKRQHHRGVFYPNLLAVIQEWTTTYKCEAEDGDKASMTVPKDVFRAAFPTATHGNTFKVGHVNQGLLGACTAEGIGGRGHGLMAYKITFDLPLLERVGVPLLQEPSRAAERVEPVDEILRDGHDYFREPWTVDGSLPAAACPREFGVRVDVDVNEPDSLANIDRLRAGYERLANGDALMAERSIPFALREDKDGGAHKDADADDALTLASSFYTTVMNLLIECVLYEPDGVTERAVVTTLDRDNCARKFWRLIERVEGGLQAQLAHLATVGNVKYLLELEKEERERELRAYKGGSPAIENRIRKLDIFINVLDKDAISQHLIEWSRVVYEANAARWEQIKRGERAGPPKLLKACRIANIPLRNARCNEVFNFLQAFGLPTTVVGTFRKVTVGERDPFGDVKECSTKDMARDAKAEVATRCVLQKALQKVRIPKPGSDKAWFYQRRLLIRYSYEAPLAPRTPECLAPGRGPVRAYDPGGRAFTEVKMESKGKSWFGSSERFSFEGREFFQGLSGKILSRTTLSGSKLSRAQLSRNERSRDAKAQLYYKGLEQKIKQAERDKSLSKGVLKALRKQLSKGYKKKQETDVEELVADNGKKAESEEEADVQKKMEATDTEFKDKLREEAERIKHYKARIYDNAKELKKKYGDEFLGPLWTDQVEARYQRYRVKREEDDLDVPTRRFFLKYKIEKRMRRKAKWINLDTHRMVEAEQDAALAQMIPEGTSLVICARLNFHNFKRLSRRVKRYFSYLALASFHDRMKIRCENVGAVLLNVCEGYTTKKCPACGHHVDVGASKWFQCSADECDFECGRDLKVRLEECRGSRSNFDRAHFANCSVC